MADAIDFLSDIKVADFADIFTGRLITEIPHALAAICDALKDNNALIEIDLSDNAFGGRSAEPMVSLLSENRSLQVLKLSNNGLGPTGGLIVASALLASAEASAAEGKESNLRVVHCGRNRLEDGSVPRFAEAFAAHGKLIDVRMPQNGIREQGIISLAQSLAKCPTMQHLDLQDNCTSEESSEEGWRALGDAIAAWPGLQTLSLSDCVLTNEGATILFGIFAAGAHTKLSVVELQNNELDDSIIELLSGVVETHLPALKTLELQWNELESDDPQVRTVSGILKRRGGSLHIDDEEEEEEEGEEEKEKEAEVAAESPGVDELAQILAKLDVSSS